MSNRLILTVAIVCMALSTANAAVNNKSLLKKLKKAKGVEVIYQSSYKGHVSPSKTSMKIAGDQNVIQRLLPEGAEQSEGRLKTATYQDWTTATCRKVASLPSGKTISTAIQFKIGEGYVKVLDDDTVMGLPCHVWRFNVNSNTIDVWWTTAIEGYRGAPDLLNSCAPDGLVLKTVRNGDSVTEAVAITPLQATDGLIPTAWGEAMENFEYQYACNHCYDISIRVFDQQAVKFSGEHLPDPSTLVAGKQYSAGGGTIIIKKVKLPDNAHDRDIYATLTQYSVGDAYDRTGSVFVIPTGKEKSFLDAMHKLESVPAFRSGDTDYHGLVSTPDYDVPLELMRFFTGFGVRQFNHNKVPGQAWVDSVKYELNVSPLADHLQGEVWIGAYIGNWDANGHRISLTLTYHPADEDLPGGVRKSIPLFNTVNLMEQDGQPYPIFMLNDNLKAKFHLDQPVKKARLLYHTTGHGGWGGGDEFNQKPNTITLDGQKVITFIPWRDDCGTYRNNSPCSGNFSNGLSSSDLSRSNWCPGTVTNPEYIYLGDLEAGDHEMTVDIPQGAPEGGSNSYWCLSGTLIYNE